MVELEEVITHYTYGDNGAGPLWCFGAPVLVRHGDEVFVSTAETGKDIPPLCNTRWQLWRRTNDGWYLAQHESDFVEREPCPLAVFRDGRLFISVNPSRSPRGTMYGADCDPHVIEIASAAPSGTPKVLRPVWAEQRPFTEHSYRAFAVDGINCELLALNIYGHEGEYFPSFLDSSGKWHVLPIIRFPIRACYPPVVLRDRAAYMLAIGDIVEPVEEWQKLKREVLKQEWDYVFRRLFYTYTPDVLKKPFSEPLEIDSAEETAGYILPQDMHVDRKGLVHLLYRKQNIQYAFMRDKYFPGQPMTDGLIHVVIEKGKVKDRQVLIESIEGSTGMSPGWARFHCTPDGRLYVVFYAAWTDKDGKSHQDNCLLDVSRSTSESPVPLGLKHPLSTFFTNTTRGGSEPSFTLDLYGIGPDDPYTLRYARVRLPER